MPPLVPRVDELDLRFGELAAAADGVVEVRVAAVDDDVAGATAWAQRGDRLVDRIAGRHHDPDDPRRRERLARPPRDRARRVAPSASYFATTVRRAIERDELVTMTHQPLHHVAAHSAKADHR